MAKAQLEVKGAERKVIKAIDTAAETYRDTRDKRMKLAEKEAESKAALLEAVKKHGADIVPNAEGEKVYRYTDGEEQFDVIFSPKENVKVRVHTDKPPADD